MAFDQTTLAVLAAAIFGSSGVFGGVYALLKWRPENDKTNVFIDAAQGAVVVQTNVITNLQAQMTEMTAKIEALEAEVHTLSLHLDKAVRERDALRWENERLKGQLGS